MNESGLFALRTASADTIKNYYDAWAQTYDDEIAASGYRAPAWVAEQAAALLPDKNAVILDAGCGTGLTGQALQNKGYARLTGIDLSAQSLEIARAKQCYEQLQQQDLGHALPFTEDRFDAITCVGTLTYINNARHLMLEFCRVGKPGACIIFTQRDDCYDQDFSDMTRALVDAGAWEEHSRSDPLPYLPEHPEYGAESRIHIDIYRVAG